jgi:hypothetical protein
LNDTDLLVPEFYDYPLQNGHTYLCSSPKFFRTKVDKPVE